MSKRPKPEKFERSTPSDAIGTTRIRSPSTAVFDGNATWSPSNFRKTVDLTKMLGKSTVDNGKLDKLIEESAKTPLSFPSLVGSKEYADVVFHVGNHALYAHRCVVEARCPPLFAVAIKDRGKKGHLTTLKADEKLVDLRSLTLILEYLYTGSVPFTEVTPAEVISLIAHAELYHIVRLRWLCDRYLQAVLNNDLFFTLLLLSDVAGVGGAKQLCLNYGSVHFEELITKKEQVHTLGIELFREFVVYSTLNAELVPDLNQQSFPNTIKDEFKIIFTAMANPDAFFTFKAANTTIPCHKAVLYAQSERFKSLFLEDGPSASENRYSLPKNISMPHEAFKSFLAWAYYRDTSFSAAHAALILPLAHDFNITALIDECSSKLRKGIAIDSVLPILNLCFSEWGKQGGYKEELSKPCLSFLMLNYAHVDLTGLRSAAICTAIAKSIRESVISGAWTTLASAEVSSAPIGDEESLVSPHDESSAAESSFSPTLSSASLTAARTSEGGDERKSARRKKRRTMAVEATDLAMEPVTPKTDTETPISPKEAETATSQEQEKPAATKEVSTPKEEPKSPKTRKEKKAEEETKEETKQNATVTTATPIAAVEKDESKPVTPAAPAVEKTESKDTVAEEKPKSEVVPAPAVESPVVVVSAPTEKVEEKHVEPTAKSPAEEKPVPKEKAAASVPVVIVSEKKDESSQPNGEVSASKSPKTPTENRSPKTPKAEASSASSLSSSEKASAEKGSSDKPTEKSSEKPGKSPETKRDKTTTQERRANLEPSTSVKAIKETFEAKGREDLVEKEAQEKIRAGRRSDKPPTSGSSSKKDGKSK